VSRIIKKRRREIRDQVRAIVIRKLQQINLAGFAEGADESETSYAEDYLRSLIAVLESQTTLTPRVEQ
jgi:hypothetical protein